MPFRLSTAQGAFLAVYSWTDVWIGCDEFAVDGGSLTALIGAWLAS
jgi:hypothetical protein